MNIAVSISDIPIASILVNKKGRIIRSNELFDELSMVKSNISDMPSVQDLLKFGLHSTDSLEKVLADNCGLNMPKPYFLKRPNNQDIIVDVLVKHYQENYILTLLPHHDFFTHHYTSAKERLYRIGQYKYDAINNEYFYSPGAQAIYGINKPHNELVFNEFFSKHPKEEREKLLKLFKGALIGNQQFSTKTYFNHNGKRIVLDLRGKVSPNEKGDVAEVNVIMRDITQEQHLLEKLKLLVMYKNAVNIPVYFIDENDQPVFPELSLFNSQPESLFSYINFSIAQYLDLKEKAVKLGQFKAKEISFDKYNTVYNISVTFEPAEKVFIWAVEEVTDKFIQEQHQAISNRLTLLGNTFSNVSHDINNVLSIALGSIELLELKIEAGKTDDLMPYIDRVKNAIDKGRNVTDRLLAFTRKPAIKVVEFEPNKELNDNKYLFEQLLNETIKLRVNLSTKPCVIRFPQGEFINILLNIVINAQDAIIDKGQSGEIEISTFITDNNRYEVHIKDSGVGIQKDNLKKIFDPFYSSKTKKQGNGIGLANVYNTVYKHNGTISVKGHSDLGGAHFILSFKSESNSAQPDKVIPIDKYIKLKGKGILVIDDEPSITDFVDVCLTEQGAHVSKASNYDDVVEALKKINELDVLITDMYMPGFSCHEAIIPVLAKFPEIKIVSMSGYVANEDKNWRYPILRKPFSFNELKSFVTENLSR